MLVHRLSVMPVNYGRSTEIIELNTLLLISFPPFLCTCTLKCSEIRLMVDCITRYTVSQFKEKGIQANIVCCMQNFKFVFLHL
jgi:hypothetical protein